ncbi:MAG TPA: biotin/lipoyl-containing protein [Blastocatellia bacterium]|jgi:biotin carboxyl carrier protein|nr:biotin/lipoyl-containing protein [Blastocatellia bacterium]
MKYEAEIDGRAVGIELEQHEGRVSATVDDRKYEAEVIRPEDGVFLIFVGERVYEARVWSESTNSLRVKLRDRLFTASIIDRKHRRASADHSQEGQQHLTAPMPGKIARVLLNPGDHVAAGEGVVVVEAMKMQNEIKSPKAGRVIEVRVSEGATVNANQVLAVVE